MLDESAGTTRYSLLGRMLQRGQTWETSWAEFVKCYGPVIYDTCARRGLREADIQDATQNVLHKLFQKLASFDRSKGRFRSWLHAVVCHAANDIARSPWQRRQATGQEAVLENEPAPQD